MKRIYYILMLLLGTLTYAEASDLKVTVQNKSKIDRVGELIEIPWQKVLKTVGVDKSASLIVTDANGKQLPYQLETKGQQSVVALLVPITVKASSSVKLTVKTGTPDSFRSMTYGRLVPERKDDYAWENNRVAFRVYGPALERTGEISNGLDIWVKCTEKLIINEWYSRDLSGEASYHEDHGEGLDFYKVGRTLGIGATAPYVGDSLWLGNNFIRCEMLDNGPLRVTCRLTYAPFTVAGSNVTETRILTLDANSHFTRITEEFEMGKPSMQIASGIVLRNEALKKLVYNAKEGYMTYTEPEDAVSGIIYAGVVASVPFQKIQQASGHLLGISTYTKGKAFIYYAGGGWSKSGFTSAEAWTAYVKNFTQSVRQPLVIRFR